MEKYIKILKQLNQKAIKNDDVPVSAIVIKDDKIVSKDYNKKNKLKNPLAHAEILAIIKAAKKLKTYNLIDCNLIVSLEPCSMCREIIKESKIKNVYYFAKNEKVINYKNLFIKLDDKNNYFSKELKDFFNSKR